MSRSQWSCRRGVGLKERRRKPTEHYRLSPRAILPWGFLLTLVWVDWVGTLATG